MKTLQHPRGTTEENDSYTGVSSQQTVDTDRWELRLHDGVTPGGHRILNLEQLKLLFMLKTSEFGQVAFDPEERGYLVRTGDKTWNLRELIEGDGITITNPLAENGNSIFAVDTDWLDEYLKGLVAGKIPFGITEGDGDQFTLATSPSDWSNETGSIAGIRFHTDANNNATLNVNSDGAIPLRLYNSSRSLSSTVKEGTRAILMRDGGSYFLVGIQPLQDIPEPEEGGTDVGALAGPLLFGELDGDESGLGFGGEGTQGAITHSNVDIEDGEARGFARTTGNTVPPPQTNPDPVQTKEFLIIVKVNGVFYADRNRGTVSTLVGGSSTGGLVYSEGDAYALNHLERLGSTFAIGDVGTFYLKTQKGTPLLAE